MTRRLIVVGTGMQAEQVQYYFEGQGGRAIDAFVLDPEFIVAASFLGRPVLDFAEAQRRFPPASHGLFVGIGMTAGAARKRWFLAARAAGYELPSFVHRTAAVADNVAVGAGTLINELVAVAPFAQLGQNIILCPQSGIGHHTRVGSHSFFAPAAVVAGSAQIGERCFIGVNATIRDRVQVGDGCIIGAGALIMANCPAGGVYRAARTARTREADDKE